MSGFYIGNVYIKNSIILSPMAGVTDPTFMKICEDMGVSYVVSELISAEAIVRNNNKTLDMLKGIDKIHVPVAVQLFGANADVLAEAARIVMREYSPDIIDINMGCPVPKVAIHANAGSALLKNPELVREIVTKVVKAVDVPVTIKIRSGWDKSSINAVAIAKIAEKAGAKAIAIHARSRADGYSGKADWSIIKEVVASVNIPVIGNGDVTSPMDAKRMLDETKCSGVMIGRALLGNPWLIRDCLDYLDKGIINELVSNDEKIDMMEYHLNELVKVKGEKLAILEIRNSFLGYLKGMPLNKEIKNELCKCSTKKEMNNVLEEYRRILKQGN